MVLYNNSTIYHYKFKVQKTILDYMDGDEFIMQPQLHLADNSVLMGHDREITRPHIMIGFTLVLCSDAGKENTCKLHGNGTPMTEKSM